MLPLYTYTSQQILLLSCVALKGMACTLLSESEFNKPSFLMVVTPDLLALPT